MITTEEITAIIDQYERLIQQEHKKDQAIQLLMDMFPEVEDQVMGLILKDIENPELRELKKNFGLVTRYKMGKVHMNGEFKLYMEVNAEDYNFMNCEYSMRQPGGIRVHTRAAISKESFENANPR